MTQFIIYDTEFASWDGFIKLPEEVRRNTNIEIVQIAALKVDLETMEVLGSFEQFIKPKEPLTDYFIKLTGLTDELLDEKGISFAEAYAKFKSFSDGLPCYSHGWSQNPDKLADGHVMNNNLKMNNIIDTKLPDYRNIAPWFMQKYQENGIDVKSQSSGQIAKILGIEKDLEHLGLDEHNALYDVYSILSGLKFLGFKELF